jgi:hypothetical protein
MAYVPDCKNDIFISYRRVSDEDPDAWVAAFRDILERSLREQLGDVEVFRDKENNRMGENWSKEIIEALDSVAIFLAIIVGTYFDSDSCRKELDRFLGKVKDPDLSSTRRILPIFKQPLNSSQNLPREISACQSGIFYQENPPRSGHFRTFGSLRGDAYYNEFKEAIGRVAQDISISLQQFRDRVRQKALGKVFLASTSPELQLHRDKLRSDLQQRRYVVSPELEYLWNGAGLVENISGDQEGSLLCIHLVQQTASSEPKTFDRMIQQLEVALGIARRQKEPFPIMAWIQPTSDKDESAGRLIDYVRNDLANEGAEIFECGLEEFKTEIFKKLPSSAGLMQPPSPRSVAPRPVAGEVALIFEECDLGALNSINILLADRFKLNPVPLKFNGALPKDPIRLARKIVRCDWCLIFWGSQSEEWVSDILELEAVGGRFGNERMCVYAAAPETVEKKVFRTPLARTIAAMSDPQQAELAVFFNNR